MVTRVQKWGNSLAVRIPKAFADRAGLDENVPVNITLEDGRLVITPVPRPAYDLVDLLAGITADNLHGEIVTGEPVGNEIW